MNIYKSASQKIGGILMKIGSKKQCRVKLFIFFSIIICGVAISLELANGGISNILAPLWGYSRVDIVGNTAEPVEATTSSDGYTLTATAIIGDRYNHAVVYALSKDNGEAISEDVFFLDWSSNIQLSASCSGSLQYIKKEENPDVLYIVESWSHSTPLIGRMATATFSNLSIHSDTGDIVIADGPWELKFILRYKDSSKEIPTNNLCVTGEDGGKYMVNRISVSPVGLHMDVVAPIPQSDDDQFDVGKHFMQDFNVALQLIDGAVVDIEASKGGAYSEDDKTAKAYYSAMYDEPIALENIDALIICDTIYKIALSS